MDTFTFLRFKEKFHEKELDTLTLLFFNKEKFQEKELDTYFFTLLFFNKEKIQEKELDTFIFLRFKE